MKVKINEWIEEEFATLDMKSPRLEKRFKMAMSDMSDEPDKSIWLASGSRTNSKAVYRMIANPKCDKASILGAHREAVAKRNEENVLLAIQDTMCVNLNGHKKTDGLGYNSEKTLGVNSHNCILTTIKGTAIGLIEQSVNTREERKSEKSDHEKRNRDIEEKESNRWLETMKTAAKNAPEGVMLIHIADREGDIYELYALAEQTGEKFVIRASKNRRGGGNILRAYLRSICGIKPQFHALIFWSN